ncbi:MAG: LuxR C-terminal-related transcriptional regulator [Desulfosoma sp.]
MDARAGSTRVSLLEQQVRELQNDRTFLENVLDSLDAHIAVLDESGVIIKTNKPWQRYAEANQLRLPPDTIGVNYLRVCDEARGEGSEGAEEAAAGIRAVMDGALSEFRMDYPCHSPSEKCWFFMRVTRFAGAGPLRIIIVHEDITPLKEIQDKLALREEELSAYAKRLEESNITLKTILDLRESEKTELQAAMVSAIRQLLVPALERLKMARLDEGLKKELEVLEVTLRELSASSIRALAGRQLGLTPMELQVAMLVREGRSSKEIASLLNISTETVGFHRRNIRRKLQIHGKSQNLREKLLALS